MQAQGNPKQPGQKTRWWVVALAIGGVLMLCVALVVGGFVWWLSENRGRLREAGKQAQAEAEVYAANHDQNECMEEGLRKLSECGGIALVCEGVTKAFTVACLQNARKVEGFCEGVPPKSEIIQTSLWVISSCERWGRQPDDQKCHRFMQGVPEACHQPERAPPDQGE
jgi:hypothetical protein